MTTSTLTSKGQATIPKEIRDYLGLKPSERVSFSIDDGKVVLRRASVRTSELAGILRHKARKPIPTKKQMREAIAQAAVERDLRTRR